MRAWSLNNLLWVGLGLIGLVCTDAAEPFPPVGKIEYYGNRTVPLETLEHELGLRPGDPAPIYSQRELERRLERIPGVSRAKVGIVCCEEGKSTLFIGIQEQAGPAFEYNPMPQGSELLPAEIVQTYDQFMETLSREVQQGNAGEDNSQGHALFTAQALHPFQERFITWANSTTALLRKALANSSRAHHRAAAAWVLGYVRDKRTVLQDLMHAVRDPDEVVRNNAIRTVGAFAALARAQPELHLDIEPAVFIKMLNSLSWSDRNKATQVLLQLTVTPAPAVLKALREQALPSLIEMARWRDGHSRMALQLVGRIAGVSDKETEAAWREGRREQIIQKAAEP